MQDLLAFEFYSAFRPAMRAVVFLNCVPLEFNILRDFLEEDAWALCEVDLSCYVLCWPFEFYRSYRPAMRAGIFLRRVPLELNILRDFWEENAWALSEVD